MRYFHRRDWQHWRTARPTNPLVHPESRITRMNTPKRRPLPLPELPPELRHETPAADGIRHALVAHIKQLIADGHYDTPERWEAAEERLLAQVLAKDSTD